MGMAQTKEHEANLSVVAGFIQGFSRSTLPCLFVLAAVLACGFLVAGIALGTAVHPSMLGLGNGLLIIGAVGVVCVWDLWSTVPLILSILELLGMQDEELLQALQAYFQSVEAADSGNIASTLIGKTHSNLTDMLYRKCQAVLLWCPLFVAIAALGCLVVALASNTSTGLIVAYAIVLGLAIIGSTVGFAILRYRVRPAILCKMGQLVNPYLEIMMKNLQHDLAISAGSVLNKDADVEQGTTLDDCSGDDMTIQNAEWHALQG